MTEHTCDFPADLSRASAPATGNLDRITFLRGLVRETAGTERPVPRGVPVLIEGWALDPGGNAGADELVVTIGQTALRARTKLPRSDVALVFRREELDEAGFRATMPTHELAPGSYAVNFHVIDRAAGVYHSWYEGMTFELGPAEDSVPRRAPGRIAIGVEAFGAETPLLGRTFAAKPPAGSVVTVAGWAVDAQACAPVGEVHFFVDDLTLDRALYGYPSEAAARRFSSPALRACGFKARFQTRTLNAGIHSFRIVAVSADGSVYDQTEEQFFEIVAPPVLPVLGTATAHGTRARIEHVYRLEPNGTTVALRGTIRVERGAALHVSGWAVDDANGAAAANVMLLVDDDDLFAAFYGAPRDDVAAELGNDAFRDSGFVGAVATGDLMPGVHTVRCLVRSSEDESWRVGSDVVRFEVS